MDDGELEMLPQCDVCGGDGATLWCDTCSQMLCERAECKGPHEGHDVASMGCEEGDEGVIEQMITEEAAFHMLDCLESSAHLVCRKLLSRRATTIANDVFPPSLRRNATTLQDAEATSAGIGGDASVMAPVILDRIDESDPSFSANKFQLPDEVWAKLGAYSCCVIDGLLSAEAAEAARAQTLQLRDQGDVLTEYRNPNDANRAHTARQDMRVFLDPPSTSASSSASNPEDSNISLSSSPSPPPMPAMTMEDGRLHNVSGPLRHAVSRLQLLGQALSRECNLIEQGVSNEYQLAYYGSEGQHYEKHRDGFPHDGSHGSMGKGQVARRVTATMYFNTDWEPSHKGHLRVHVPVSADARRTQAVDIEPVAGRVVVFLSGAMDHEVMPSAAPRCAMAAWYC